MAGWHSPEMLRIKLELMRHYSSRHNNVMYDIFYLISLVKCTAMKSRPAKCVGMLKSEGSSWVIFGFAFGINWNCY